MMLHIDESVFLYSLTCRDDCSNQHRARTNHSPLSKSGGQGRGTDQQRHIPCRRSNSFAAPSLRTVRSESFDGARGLPSARGSGTCRSEAPIGPLRPSTTKYTLRTGPVELVDRIETGGRIACAEA